MSVVLPSGKGVLTDTFLDFDAHFKQLALAAAKKIGIALAQCVLLSNTGERIEFSSTPSREGLVDGSVLTILLTRGTRVFASRDGHAFAQSHGKGLLSLGAMTPMVVNRTRLRMNLQTA